MTKVRASRIRVKTTWVCNKAKFFILVDLRRKKSDLGSRGQEKPQNFENDQLTGHFQSFVFLKYLQKE